MGMLLADLKGLAVAVVFAATGCNAPDSSGLYEPASIRTETPGIEASPDAGGDLGNGAAGAPDGESTPPPNTIPVVGNDTGTRPPLEPPTPSPPTADAGPPSDPVTPEPVTPDPIIPDAGSEPPPPPPPEPECAGALLDGVCWYLGELDQTCNTVCATRGGVVPASAESIGTPAQGGTIESCAAVLEALGEPSIGLMEGFREDALGFGCHLFVDVNGAASAWWLTSPNFSPAVSDPSARLACGCAR